MKITRWECDRCKALSPDRLRELTLLDSEGAPVPVTAFERQSVELCGDCWTALDRWFAADVRAAT